ncbi:BMP family ABC transporter substrate-binding protein [archaeon]|nr:BMP family ABC transporter substrate-binding protein [archaeon]
MKKLLIILMITTLLITFVATGCSKKDDGEKDLKVGFIYIGPIDDNGWTSAHDEGRKTIEEELGLETIYKENVPEDDAQVEQEIKNLIDQGANVIFTTSFGFMDATLNVAKEYPDVKFFHCSGFKTNDNMGNYFGRIYEPRFLSGLVAGLKTETNKIGYVAAMQIPEVIRGINAFTLGVKTANPDAEVFVRWTNTWIDPSKAKEAAEALLEEDCDVLTQHQDSPGPLLAAEDAGAYSIGYDYPLRDVAPDSYMTAPLFNWGVYYVDILQEIIDGTWVPGSFWGGLKDEIVKLDELTDVAPADAQALVDDYQGKIEAGTFHVFSGEIKDRNGNVKVAEGETMTDGDMLSMMWFVEGVNGSLDNEE